MACVIISTYLIADAAPLEARGPGVIRSVVALLSDKQRLRTYTRRHGSREPVTTVEARQIRVFSYFCFRMSLHSKLQNQNFVTD